MSRPRKSDSEKVSNQLNTLKQLNGNAQEDIAIIRGGGTEYFNQRVNWTDICSAYVVGKRIECVDEDTGIKQIFSESYSIQELADVFKLNYFLVAKKARTDNWSSLRESYLARVNGEAMGRELSYFTDVESRSEAQALAITAKVIELLNLNIEAKFGDIIDGSVLEGDEAFANDLRAKNIEPMVLAMSLEALAKALKVQREVLDAAPRSNIEMASSVNQRKNAERLANPKERKKLMAQLEANQKLLKQIEDDENIIDI